MQRAAASSAALLLCACAPLAGGADAGPRQRATVVAEPAGLAEPTAVEVRLDGEVFLRCRTTARRPVVEPLLARGGVPVTRGFPLAPRPMEPADHPHHESLWFAHGLVDGVDFWAGDGRIEVVEQRVDAGQGAVTSRCVWRDGAGREVCRDRRRMVCWAQGDWRVAGFEIVLQASDGPLVLGDTKEGTFALRLRPEFSLRGGGSILTSAGRRDAAAWGQRADWVAYAGVVDGAPLFVAVLELPGSHGAPTCWHARDYGLCAANPFGLSDFLGAAKDAGRTVVDAGQELRFAYRVVVGPGAPDPARLAALRLAQE